MGFELCALKLGGTCCDTCSPIYLLCNLLQTTLTSLLTSSVQGEEKLQASAWSGTQEDLVVSSLVAGGTPGAVGDTKGGLWWARCRYRALELERVRAPTTVSCFVP